MNIQYNYKGKNLPSYNLGLCNLTVFSNSSFKGKEFKVKTLLFCYLVVRETKAHFRKLFRTEKNRGEKVKRERCCKVSIIMTKNRGKNMLQKLS